MVELTHETNIEVIREFARIVQTELIRAHEKIDELKRARDEAMPPRELWLDEKLQDQLHRLQKKFYGFGRESLKDLNKQVRPVGHEGQQLLLHGLRAQDSAVENLAQSETSSASYKNSQEPLVIEHLVLEKDLVEEMAARGLDKTKASSAFKKINGLYQESVEITVTERTYQKVVHRQAKYRLKDEYNTTGKEVIVTAPGPVKVKAGSSYSVDFALSVVSDKYEYHVPLERQRRKMEGEGFDVDVKTLYTLCEAVAEHVRVIEPEIKKEIQTDFCAVHLDETPWRILSTGEQGYLWVMSNRLGSFYQFEPTRSGKVASDLLKNYTASIVCDAYGGYNRLRSEGQIRIQHCWAHARREFYERYDDYPGECLRVIEIIDELFEVERCAKTFEELSELRREKSQDVIARLKDLLFEIRPRFLKSEGISKAIQYCLNHWAGLTHFLTDLTVPLTNNDAERALRHAVVGRKNFLGSKTINGADTMASLYTVIETCKRNSTQPTEYLKYLITERWHKRVPLTPKQYADKKLGPNTKIKWPARNEWQV